MEATAMAVSDGFRANARTPYVKSCQSRSIWASTFASRVLGLAPVGAQPPGVRHPVERGIQLSLLDSEHAVRDLPDAGADRVAVQGPAREQHLEDDEIERAAEAVV